jgi:hypothetical protein
MRRRLALLPLALLLALFAGCDAPCDGGSDTRYVTLDGGTLPPGAADGGVAGNNLAADQCTTYCGAGATSCRPVTLTGNQLVIECSNGELCD